MQHEEYPDALPGARSPVADAIGRFDPALVDIEPAVVLVLVGWAAWACSGSRAPGVAAAVALALTGAAPLVANACGELRGLRS